MYTLLIIITIFVRICSKGFKICKAPKELVLLRKKSMDDLICEGFRDFIILLC